MLHLYQKYRENMMNYVTQLIVEQRKEMKLSQKEMAKGLGISRQHYNRIEKGNMSLEYFLIICKILDLQVLLVPEKFYNHDNIKGN